MKQSKIKKLVSKKVALQVATSGDAAEVAARLRVAGADTIAKMRCKGYDLVSCLATGEGVFVRDSAVVSLHIQLPDPLYRQLDDACRRQETTKRSIVLAALRAYLGEPAVTD